MSQDASWWSSLAPCECTTAAAAPNSTHRHWPAAPLAFTTPHSADWLSVPCCFCYFVAIKYTDYHPKHALPRRPQVAMPPNRLLRPPPLSPGHGELKILPSAPMAPPYGGIIPPHRTNKQPGATYRRRKQRARCRRPESGCRNCRYSSNTPPGVWEDVAAARTDR
ncbi:hypothetical protein C8R45DRAFT_1082259 [Mycena sanguinolenta]|nr:hypothetical protein C8R45DRAFT_1082259 [Mycena sanguinolenta]